MLFIMQVPTGIAGGYLHYAYRQGTLCLISIIGTGTKEKSRTKWVRDLTAAARCWRARKDSNLRHLASEASALSS